MSSALELIIRDAKVDFLIAKHDGVLEASEVVQIALTVAKKVYALTYLSEDEKDSLVLLTLKKGLAAAGGMGSLPAFSALPAAAVEVVEEQLMKAGVTAVREMRKALPAIFAPVKKALLGCLPYCSLIESVASVVQPKDAKLVKEAVSLVHAVVDSPAESTQVVVVEKSEAPLVKLPEDIPLPNTPEKESSPVASD
jgi:hypothetical protein